ncbi:WhiB family transcriptional regulator [Streptomyces sp. NBC_00289]|uniref:WhiB family transcriptional regulator n=1 Tax=Streptomyces sp. NBC_00289 TaxID=2975703 RepID=UPI00352D3EEA
MNKSSEKIWQEGAACTAPGIDPDIFFPSNQSGQRGWDGLAKKVCHKCNVSELCFRMALREGITEGIWGGLNGWERHNVGGPRPTRGRRPTVR